MQADPIRAPARAQDLTLRHRVKGYRAGDLERRYAELDIEEDFFVNYGFLPRAVQTLMHPRARRVRDRSRGRKARGAAGLRARARGGAPARGRRSFLARLGHELLGRFVDGDHAPARTACTTTACCAWRGATGGIRLYAAHVARAGADATRPDARARVDALVDVAVQRVRAAARRRPWPGSSTGCATPCRNGRASCKRALKRARGAARARARRGHRLVLAGASRASRERAADDVVRLLAPFDPVVWDRRRFELLWGWAYRFEAYTPAPRRKLGYYALPLLWRDRIIGWGNLSVANGELRSDVGYVAARPPRDALFARELAAELDRLRGFLGLLT